MEDDRVWRGSSTESEQGTGGTAPRCSLLKGIMVVRKMSRLVAGETKGLMVALGEDGEACGVAGQTVGLVLAGADGGSGGGTQGRRPGWWWQGRDGGIGGGTRDGRADGGLGRDGAGPTRSGADGATVTRKFYGSNVAPRSITRDGWR